MTINTFIVAIRKFIPKGYGSRLRPHRDWMVLMVATLLILIGSLAWNIWFFFNAVERDLAASSGAEPQTALDRTVLEEARATLTAQEEEEERYRSEYRFVDPAR